MIRSVHLSAAGPVTTIPRHLSGISVLHDRQRGGWTLLETLFLVAIFSFLFLISTPWLLELRETSRRKTCQQRLHTLTIALQQYHDVHERYPPAALWDVNVTASVALHRSKRIERITQSNWALLLMPWLKVTPTSVWQVAGSIGDPENQQLRTTRVSLMVCPSDDRNRTTNPYRLESASGGNSIEFARGNFAINGGTHNFETEMPNTTSSRGDFLHLEMSDQPRHFAMWGNGIAGINKSFSLRDFTNSKGTLVAFEEVRAGIDPRDSRGVWALGQIGGSITWAHGVNGDDAGPNNKWIRADDILGCALLHEQYGAEGLQRLGMPCVDYVDANQQATARSQHPGGVHVSFLDGTVRWVSNEIDSGIWHVLHSRETPAETFESGWERSLHRSAPVIPTTTTYPEPGAHQAVEHEEFRQIENSIGMKFRQLPSGTFLMGVADLENRGVLPSEAPPHEVELTLPFAMGVHEVTRRQFAQVSREGSLPELSADLAMALSEFEQGQLPVTGITWDAADRFCRSLSDLPEEKRVKRTYRLPTEAEWEYACRAGERTEAIWKQRRDPDDHSGAAAGILPPLPLQPVGSWPANRWGICEMRGNAWEWTADWYQRDYYAVAERKNPSGPASGFLKVIRGSDWRFVGERCFVDSVVAPPWKENPFVGFRVVCERSE